MEYDANLRMDLSSDLGHPVLLHPSHSHLLSFFWLPCLFYGCIKVGNSVERHTTHLNLPILMGLRYFNWKKSGCELWVIIRRNGTSL